MVKTVFKTIGTVIICIFILAFGINVLCPNLITQVVGKVEQGIKAGTGAEIDLNGDGTAGSVGATNSTASDDAITVAGSDGWN